MVYKMNKWICKFITHYVLCYGWMYVMCNIMHCIAANIREVVIVGLLLQHTLPEINA